MNKKISQFDLAQELTNDDILTIVQSGENKNITVSDLTTHLDETFATDESLSGVSDSLTELSDKVDANYTDLSNKITEGDEKVTSNLSSTITSYYDVLNNAIIDLEEKHDTDMAEANSTIQDWIDDVDQRSTLEQLNEALNRLTVAENTITALAETIANGGGTSTVPGYHTQSTATIFPLTGYYKSTSSDPLATTDTLNQALSKLENQIDAVVSSSGSLPVIKSNESITPTDSNIYTALKVKQDYLNKHGDTADGKITFLQGLQAGSIFKSGWDGQGASLYPNGSKWNMELDNLFVRGNMTVNELTVNEIKAVGGDILVTLADMKCTEVERLSDGYKCYFDTEDGTKYNEFVANDMAICQKFDGKNVKRYWRKVNEVGTDYIVLSLDVCEAGSGTPEADDEILQLGHMYEADADYNLQMDERRNAIFISAKGDNAPRISFYKNIDDFTLADSDGVVRERVCIGGTETKFVGTIYQTSNTGISRIPVYKGKWLADNTYYYYDEVTHEGSLWICMNPNGSTAMPSDDEDDWQKVVAKGDAGKASDDVAKWVEITGSRLFLFDSPDYTGTPDPESLSLTANTYGMTNPTYTWNTVGDPTTISNQQVLVVPYTFFETRTTTVRCTVTNDDGSTYYDEVQLAKLANGAEGLDAYYVDLTNSTAAIPYDEFNSPKVSLSTITTSVYVYYGITETSISSMTYTVSEGEATVNIADNVVTLISLTSDKANIDLNIKLPSGVEVTKTWYVSKVKDGDGGFNGEDAKYIYMSGEQVFHYAAGQSVPTPTTITLTSDAFNISSPQYQWYWSISGAYDWQILENETNSELVVSYNGSYFDYGEEISFKCIVTDAYGLEYYDFMTINRVYDGENVYHGILTNENATVPALSDGTVVSDSWGESESSVKLKYGSTWIDDFTITGYTSPEVGTGTLTYDATKKILKCEALSTDSARWRITFQYPEGTDVDYVDYNITKSKKGDDGLIGDSIVEIYARVSGSSQPNKPTLTTYPASNGTYSNGWYWYPDPGSSTSFTIWASKGKYDSNTGLYSDWTTPVRFSGKDGEKGDKGDKGDTGDAGADGEDGVDGPSLSYRGVYSSSKIYQYTTNPDYRDVVQYTSNNETKYYFVNKNYRGKSFSGKAPTSTYVGTDGDGNSAHYWVAFGTTFESVATGLLFAEKASIAGWDFYNDKIVGTNADASTLYVGGATSTENNYAGITCKALSGNTSGNGNNIAFWAGESWENRANAAFRVCYNGQFYSTGAHITGAVTATSGSFTGDITCNSLNVTNYTNWGGPGVRLIGQLTGYSDSTATVQQLYSTGGWAFKTCTRSNKGRYIINFTNPDSNTNFNVITQIHPAKTWSTTWPTNSTRTAFVTYARATQCYLVLKSGDTDYIDPVDGNWSGGVTIMINCY